MYVKALVPGWRMLCAMRTFSGTGCVRSDEDRELGGLLHRESVLLWSNGRECEDDAPDDWLLVALTIGWVVCRSEALLLLVELPPSVIQLQETIELLELLWTSDTG